MTIAAIWDMDGVLVDTGQLHYQSWVESLASIGFPLSYQEFSATYGMNNTSILKYLLGPDIPQPLIDRLGDQKEESFRRMAAGKVQVLPGVRPLLAALGAAGVRQALGSSAPQANIDVLLEAGGLRPYFEAVVSAWAMPGKPDPAVYLEAARQLGVPPRRCVVIEDAVPGVEGARRAGMQCIAVTNTHPAEALSAASLVVKSLEEVTAETVMGLVKD
jgi:beta-phosphoglucomutase